jgi:hypothetical protein
MLKSYSKCLSVKDEHPADTDLRTVMRHLDEWLPVGEMAGLRLFENDLKNLPGSRIVKTIKTLPLYSPEMLRH